MERAHFPPRRSQFQYSVRSAPYNMKPQGLTSSISYTSSSCTLYSTSLGISSLSLFMPLFHVRSKLFPWVMSGHSRVDRTKLLWSVFFFLHWYSVPLCNKATPCFSHTKNGWYVHNEIACKIGHCGSRSAIAVMCSGSINGTYQGCVLVLSTSCIVRSTLDLFSRLMCLSSFTRDLTP